jgi:subtilisin family serine protease
MDKRQNQSIEENSISFKHRTGQFKKPYIVVLQDGEIVTPELSYQGKSAKRRFFRSALSGFASDLVPGEVAQLRRDARVKYIVPDKIIKASAQVKPTGIRRALADQNQLAAINGDGGELDVDVAVIDTGIDSSHPDLNVVEQVNFTADPTADDGNGHGTHVAGTAAARDNSDGVVGMAPGARLWGIKVLDANGSGRLSDVIAGIDFVAENADQIEVANMSLGGPGRDDRNCGIDNRDPMHQAICRAVDLGVVFVVAAGNEAQDAANVTPAAYDEVLTVSAIVDTDGQAGGLGGATSVGADDSLASFSNFGADVDLAAPGVAIESTVPGGGLASFSGTSMASPHVAGGVALLLTTQSKPSDFNGVKAVHAALLNKAFAQDSASGFNGDVDGFAEPLLNAQSLGEADNDEPEPVSPALTLSVRTDKDIYIAGEDSFARLTIEPRTELDEPVSGLPVDNFILTLDGQGIDGLNFSGSQSGVYTADINLADLATGAHTLKATVTDDRGLTAEAATVFEVQSQDGVFVSAVTYATKGGRKNTHLTIQFELGTSNPKTRLRGSQVFFNLFRDGQLVDSLIADAKRGSVAEFSLKGAPAGCYTTQVFDIAADGLVHLSDQDAADSGFCL